MFQGDRIVFSTVCRIFIYTNRQPYGGKDRYGVIKSSVHSSNQQIAKVLKACMAGERAAQKELYQSFYSYAMSICMRYANNREDAVEVMNDGFVRVFTYLNKFDMAKPFHPWLRRILINCAIDRFKKENKNRGWVELEEALNSSVLETQLDSITYEEMLELIRKLSPAYRTVFNLHAIEGFKHEEIAEKLGISVGTSKSNYAKARKKLQEYLNMFFEVDK